ncbi:GntR family transcriptional regulator YhfZ [Pseudostreptobacillus hongkongensis]|uniref:GntR family transcriptional regulator YhfZ n=1 Tax=Pseudostreptobacillus hongkongensis TaxID=1162717 RepID=UPI000834CCBF|nr:GntR family transcriptional regulator YhfZ [Pseudostreptobacillus hongkongensis]
MENIRIINKVEIALIHISRDILTLHIGDKVNPVKYYSEILGLSVGTVQKAFDILENEEVIRLSKKGAFGKNVEYMNKEKLIKKADLKSIVGVMPLPYSKRYEGLATAIKSAFESYGINFYFAYMQGSRVRLKLLKEGIYDFAIMSNLAYLNSNDKEIKKIISLGNESYVSKHVLLSVNDNSRKLRVGIDKNSEDQSFLSSKYYENNKCDFIQVNSDSIISNLKNNIIDQAILSIDELEENYYEGINIKDIDIKEKELANIAVLVSKKGNTLIESLLKEIINTSEIKAIQEKVLKKEMLPRY